MRILKTIGAAGYSELEVSHAKRKQNAKIFLDGRQLDPGYQLCYLASYPSGLIPPDSQGFCGFNSLITRVERAKENSDEDIKALAQQLSNDLAVGYYRGITRVMEVLKKIAETGDGIVSGSDLKSLDSSLHVLILTGQEKSEECQFFLQKLKDDIKSIIDAMQKAGLAANRETSPAR